MPELLVDVAAIGTNTEVVVRLLKDRGVDLVAVTKGCLGEPLVAAAMLAAGAAALADTRDANLRRLRKALPNAALHRINLPSLTVPFEPGDVTYVSSWEGAEAVAGVAAAAAAGAPRRVVLQVETGDEREGVPLDQVMGLAQRITGHPGLQLEGVSTNYDCFKGAPTEIEASVATVAQVTRDLRTAGLKVPRVSGGNSSVLWLVVGGKELPPEVTELRCGEVLLLGHEALHYQQLPGCRADACRIRAEVVEEYTRPSAAGPVRRLVLAVGYQDVGTGVVKFVEPDLREIGRSSDYLVVEADGASGRMALGTTTEMIPAYEALVAAWMSPYVDVRLY